MPEEPVVLVIPELNLKIVMPVEQPEDIYAEMEEQSEQGE